MDWTFDLFMEDARQYTAEEPDNASDYRQYFMGWFKRAAKRFEVEWSKTHEHQYDRRDGYIGDAFGRTLTDWFSDFYKDAYGQRPHLPVWFYVHAVGFPQSADTARTFCASPMEDAERAAKEVRESWSD